MTAGELLLAGIAGACVAGWLSDRVARRRPLDDAELDILGDALGPLLFDPASEEAARLDGMDTEAIMREAGQG